MRKGGIYLALGDSITWTMPSDSTPSGDNLYASLVWKYINENYQPIRLINKGIGGQTSTEMLQNLRWNSLIEADLITIGIGMNDSSSTVVPVNTYKSNLDSILDSLVLRSPEATIILCTPSRTTEASRVDNIESYRTAMGEVVTTRNSSKIKLCQFENAWIQDDTGTYTTDTIHPTTAGHALLAGVLETVIQTLF